MGDLSANFSRYEFACKDKCGFDTVDIELLMVLQDLRDHFKTGVFLSSGCRCLKYNTAIRGASKSKHMHGMAADVQITNIRPKQVADYLEDKYPEYYGIGRYKSFTHIDVRSKKPARWGHN